MQASRSKLWRPRGNCEHNKLCLLEGAAPHLMLTMCFLSNCTRCPRCRPCILVTLLTICERRVRVRRWSLVNCTFSAHDRCCACTNKSQGRAHASCRQATLKAQARCMLQTDCILKALPSSCLSGELVARTAHSMLRCHTALQACTARLKAPCHAAL